VTGELGPGSVAPADGVAHSGGRGDTYVGHIGRGAQRSAMIMSALDRRGNGRTDAERDGIQDLKGGKM